jgi:Domain of unknown function (DUF4249)
MKVAFSWKYLFVCLLLFCFFNCQVPYTPPVKLSATGYLVVEGYIDGGAPTMIYLSRTVPLSDTSEPVAETGAKIVVEDNLNHTYLLQDEGKGVYSSVDTLPINSGDQYRIHIVTSEGEEYQSDFVPVRISPPIDSINWVLKNGGVQIYANTHDPQNNTPYYRWTYNETWERRSEYTSYFKFYESYNGTQDVVVPRTSQVYECWSSDISTNLILGSSVDLRNNVVYEQPLTYIQDHDPRISVLYSILVMQYSLDSAEYSFLYAMQRNTEQIGSFFDPQPSNIAGNIHCLSQPDEQVIGYIGAGIPSQTRIYISNNQMPLDWNPSPYCKYTTIVDNKDTLQYYFGALGYSPINQGPGYYTAALTPCVDCTLYGTNVKPSFWP